MTDITNERLGEIGDLVAKYLCEELNWINLYIAMYPRDSGRVNIALAALGLDAEVQREVIPPLQLFQYINKSLPNYWGEPLE